MVLRRLEDHMEIVSFEVMAEGIRPSTLLEVRRERIPNFHIDAVFNGEPVESLEEIVWTENMQGGSVLFWVVRGFSALCHIRQKVSIVKVKANECTGYHFCHDIYQSPFKKQGNSQIKNLHFCANLHYPFTDWKHFIPNGDIGEITRSSAIAERLRDALVSTNFATTKHPIFTVRQLC